MLHSGAKCVIWAEKGSGVSKTMAKTIADEYDKKIRPCIVNAFSEKNFAFSYKGAKYQFSDMLDFANWIVGRNDKKLTILLLDIQDGFIDPREDSFVAGYFFSGDFMPKGKNEDSGGGYYSNARDMIYVDTYPGMKDQPTQAYATFAHELQHLVNFVTCFWLGKGNTDVWVNEGLSAYAEYLYLGGNPRDKCGWLLDDRNTIKTGNNFFVWGNHKDKPLANLDDYATVYLFFRWLYLHADAELQSRIIHDIANSSFTDYRAVTDVAKNIDPAWSDWETLLRTWLTANYYPQNLYGYTGDNELRAILKIDPIAVEGNTLSLFPGEGVYSIINGNYSTISADNIRYKEISSNILLTFNANTNNSATSEDGSLTGVSPSITVSKTAAENPRHGKWSGPYVIDAQDILGRDRDMPILLSR